jgi:hypothetical protein
MEVKRYINTKIWDDTWYEELGPEHKLIWLYLLTNNQTNLLGIYEISIRKIAYHTRINIDEVAKAIQKFQEDDKVFYVDNHIIIVNFFKNQNLNSNMMKNVIENYKELKDSVKDVIKNNHLKGFQRLSKALKGFERLREKEEEKEEEKEKEKEKERERESENEKPKKPARSTFKKPDILEVKSYFIEIGLYDDEAEQEGDKFYNHYEANGWKVGAKNTMKDWRAAVRNWHNRMKEFKQPEQKKHLSVTEALKLI